MEALKIFKFLLMPKAQIASIEPLTLAAIAGGAQLAGTLAPLIGRKKREKQYAERLEAAGKSFETPGSAKEATEVARGMTREGDPFAAAKTRAIEQGSSEAVGRIKATTGSAQDVLKAIQGVQEQKNVAMAQNLGSQAAFKFDAKRYLSAALGRQAGLELTTDQLNQQAIEAEIQRQAMDKYARMQTGRSLGSDLGSTILLSQYAGGVS